ncbi:MAG: ATP-binding protein [bacterium]|nr:ATP-binding protein [bacterium]
MMARAKKTPVTINIESTEDRDEAISDVLFDSIGEGAMITDEMGNISRINSIALEILGFTTDELIGAWYPSTLVAEDEDGRVIPNVERPITEAFLSGKPVTRRLYYLKKDGKRVPVALNVAPIIIRDKPVGAIVLFHDITDEIQLERAKDEFISIASHQLRTPATVVKQSLGLVLEGYIQSKKQQTELLHIAYEHNNNQLEIINDLLNIAQVEASKLKPDVQEINLISLLKKIVKGQRTDYKERQIELELMSEVKNIRILADPLHVQMVFENLINNAQKYSPSNTKVTVNASATRKYATVLVKDQGYGIAEEDIDSLFRKFSRIENVNSTASGTGLGLYWAKKLVELHGGEISVSSKLNEGTTFNVTLLTGKS